MTIDRDMLIRHDENISTMTESQRELSRAVDSLSAEVRVLSRELALNNAKQRWNSAAIAAAVGFCSTLGTWLVMIWVARKQ